MASRLGCSPKSLAWHKLFLILPLSEHPASPSTSLTLAFCTSIYPEPTELSWCLIRLSFCTGPFFCVRLPLAAWTIAAYPPVGNKDHVLHSSSIPAIQPDKPASFFFLDWVFLCLVSYTFLGSVSCCPWSSSPPSIHLPCPWALSRFQIWSLLGADWWTMAFLLCFFSAFSLPHQPHSDSWTSVPVLLVRELYTLSRAWILPVSLPRDWTLSWTLSAVWVLVPNGWFLSKMPCALFGGLLLLGASCLEALFGVGTGSSQLTLCQAPLATLYWMAVWGASPVALPLSKGYSHGVPASS